MGSSTEVMTVAIITAKRSNISSFTAVRQMFPRKIRMNLKGKAVGGRNLYSMTGRILLNGGLSADFERLTGNKKGEVGKPALPAFSSGPLCGSKEQGFDTLGNGVRHNKVVEPKVVVREYPAHWGKLLKIDLTELAELRWVKRWTIKQLMAHFGASYAIVMRSLRAVRHQHLQWEAQNERVKSYSQCDRFSGRSRQRGHAGKSDTVINESRSQ